MGDGGGSERIEEVRQRIEELRARLPKHSVPPRMLIELEDLEEELSRLTTKDETGPQ